MAKDPHSRNSTVEELRRQVERDRMTVEHLQASPSRHHLLSTALLMLEASIGRLKAAEESMRAGGLEAQEDGPQLPLAPLGLDEPGISPGASPGMPEME